MSTDPNREQWTPSRVVLVPGVLALLPEYAGLTDPVAELRAACVDAVRWLGDGFGVQGSRQGLRLARHLAREARVLPDLEPEHPDALLVVANGTATRSEKAPGHLDERAHAFDDALGRALVAPDPAALRSLDLALAAELWADAEPLVALGEVLTPEHRAHVDHDADPYGVQYWVMRWER